MSRGHGKVKRAILDLMANEPDGAWTIDELCKAVYQSINRVKKKHKVAVLRAGHKIMMQSPEWEFRSGMLTADRPASRWQVGDVHMDSGRHARIGWSIGGATPVFRCTR